MSDADAPARDLDHPEISPAALERAARRAIAASPRSLTGRRVYDAEQLEVRMLLEIAGDAELVALRGATVEFDVMRWEHTYEGGGPGCGAEIFVFLDRPPAIELLWILEADFEPALRVEVASAPPAMLPSGAAGKDVFTSVAHHAMPIPIVWGATRCEADHGPRYPHPGDAAFLGRQGPYDLYWRPLRGGAFEGIVVVPGPQREQCESNPGDFARNWGPLDTELAEAFWQGWKRAEGRGLIKLQHEAVELYGTEKLPVHVARGRLRAVPV